MAEYKLYNLKDPKTGQEEPQISSKEEFDAIKQKVPTSSIKNPRTGQEGSAESVVKEGDMNPGENMEATPAANQQSNADFLELAKDLAKCLHKAFDQHSDELSSKLALKNLTTQGVRVVARYAANDQGQVSEDEFEFRWPNGVITLDNVARPVEIAKIQKQSGHLQFQKDIAIDNLVSFLNSHDEVDSSDTVDPNALPDGPVAEEQLWESEECQQAFCDAVEMYRKAKDKESVKNLFRAARPYQKGNTIQEKLKGAVDWYNIYTQKPPKNTKEQVFLEDAESSQEELKKVWDLLQQACFSLNKLRQSEEELNVPISNLLWDAMVLEDRVGEYVKEYDVDSRERETKNIRELIDLNDPIANGEPDNYGGFGRDNDEFNSNHEEWDDEPIVHEGDEWGPEVGDDVDYEGGHYKLYGYCGYEVVLQNVDDERDFKVVKPENVGIKAPQKDLKETDWVDPDELPNDEIQRV